MARLNEGLSLFDAILIVPMFQIAWTSFSICTGFVYFQEYQVLCLSPFLKFGATLSSRFNNFRSNVIHVPVFCIGSRKKYLSLEGELGRMGLQLTLLTLQLMRVKLV